MIDPLILDLLTRRSISPADDGCQALLTKELKSLGFNVEPLNRANVSNLWAKKLGRCQSTLLFAGHTDVVPTGFLANWLFDPFLPTVSGEYLYARGAADMKIALCCMVLACKDFVTDYPDHNGGIAFLITSCEEKTTENGTKYAMEELCNNRQEKPAWCIVGEASSQKKLGDQIKIGRRGSLTAELQIFGKQGHIAYPDLAINPIHQSFLALEDLIKTKWDEGNEFFSPTSCQISSIQSGGEASNIIPGELNTIFNFRYSTEVTAEIIQERVQKILDAHNIKYHLKWSHSGKPLLTKVGNLVVCVEKAIKDIVQLKPHYSTTGGTSDARFIAPHGVETIELGFCNETIHQANERVLVEDILKLKNIYYQTMKYLLL